MVRSASALANPKVLRWAREEIGYNLVEASEKIGISNPEILRKAENGEDKITIKQLRKAAYVYHRPLPLFFLKEIPKNVVNPDFRFIFDPQSKVISPEAKKKILDIASQRDFLREITNEKERSFKYDSYEIDKKLALEDIALEIRSILGISYKLQTEFKSEYNAFNTWRDSIEISFGILVYQLKSIEVHDLRGFCIHNYPFPVIAINRKDSPNARCFTLMHELCHILSKSSDICKSEDLLLKIHDKNEIYCNQMAGEILVPTKYILEEPIVKNHNIAKSWSKSELNKLSNKYKVSKEVILRRLLSLKKATRREYKKYRAMTSKTKSTGPKRKSDGFNWYRGYISRQSHYYLKTVLDKVDSNEVSVIDASLNMHVKINNFEKLSKEYFGLYK